MTRTSSAETPPAAARPPQRAALASATERVLNRGGWSNPDVLLVRHEGGLLVVKDFAARSAWVRFVLAPWLSAREERAWLALLGHPAVPRYLGRIDSLAFAVAYRPGATLFSARGEPVAESFLSELEEAVAEMHRRGVVHGDLSNRTNVLRASLSCTRGRRTLATLASQAANVSESSSIKVQWRQNPQSSGY
jgi:hypothetical protein